MEYIILHDIVVIFGLAVAVLYICHRLKVPAIVGFLLTGILAGPHGLALVSSVEQVEAIAEFGVILLLFSIGLEFSFKSLVKIHRTILLGGTLQVGLSIILTFALARLAGLPMNSAVFLGFLVSLSSTAIVLKQMGEKVELDTPHGKTALGILIYQDIIVVAMMLLTPLLGTGGGNSVPFTIILIKAAAMIALVIVLSLYIIPPLLYQITRTQSRELFLLSIMVICFSVAWLTSSAGLSLALGAFLAGLIIAESEYSHQALASIIPFIDTFTSLFFVSIGMLLNTEALVGHFGTVLLFTLLLIIIKAIVAAISALALGYPLRTSILVGFALCQIGEFSFILAQVGMDSMLLSEPLYQGFLSASILSMMLTPFMMSIAPQVAAWLYKLPLPTRFLTGMGDVREEKEEPGLEQEDHLIIIGYGVNGKNISRAAAFAGISYVVLDINADTVREEKERGIPIYFGDATHKIVLEYVNVQSARVVVIAISDPAATRRITYMVRKSNPSAHIIVRTRFVADMHDLYELGANEVIPEEYETSIEIFARVLDRYMVPEDEIEYFVDKVRREGYEMLRSLAPAQPLGIRGATLIDLDLSTLKAGSLIAGSKLKEVDFRNRYGITIVAIRRGEEIISNPGKDDIIQNGDCLIVLGEPENVRVMAREIC